MAGGAWHGVWGVWRGLQGIGSRVVSIGRLMGVLGRARLVQDVWRGGHLVGDILLEALGAGCLAQGAWCRALDTRRLAQGA